MRSSSRDDPQRPTAATSPGEVPVDRPLPTGASLAPDGGEMGDDRPTPHHRRRRWSSSAPAADPRTLSASHPPVFSGFGSKQRGTMPSAWLVETDSGALASTNVHCRPDLAASRLRSTLGDRMFFRRRNTAALRSTWAPCLVCNEVTEQDVIAYRLRLRRGLRRRPVGTIERCKKCGNPRAALNRALSNAR